MHLRKNQYKHKNKKINKNFLGKTSMKAVKTVSKAL